jgi:hypothetical protein
MIADTDTEAVRPKMALRLEIRQIAIFTHKFTNSLATKRVVTLPSITRHYFKRCDSIFFNRFLLLDKPQCSLDVYMKKRFDDINTNNSDRVHVMLLLN